MMMSIEQENLTQELAVVKAEINRLQERKTEIGEQLLPFICPYNVGDVVPVLGYAHRGKSMRILARGFDHSTRKGTGWFVRGVVLKKDGSDSRFIVIFGDYEYSREVQENE